MNGRKLLGLLGLSGGALVLGLVAACSAPPGEATQGSSSSVTTRAFDRNSVIDDISTRDSAAMTADDLQTFLEKTPWGTKSALATFSENGKTAAEIMVDAAKTYSINPIEMVVRVQMEQGLVSKTTATAAVFAKAFGCGCADGAACTAKYSGFSAQADCAAGTMSRSMTRALTTTGTVSGWMRGKAKESLDGLTIVPKNAATAALYTYTPWVGEAGGGKAGVGGVSLHAQVWNRFATAMSYGAWAAPTTGGANTAESATDDAGATATADPTTDTADAGTDPPADPPADPTTDPSTDPPADPSTDPTLDPDAGDPTDPATGATGDGTTVDAGADAGKKKPSTKGPPADGSDDGAILGEGSAPPASNAPPIGNSSIPSHPEELPEASEAELAGKKKSSAGGCSTTGHEGGSSNALLIVGAAALAITSARRKRR